MAGPRNRRAMFFFGMFVLATLIGARLILDDEAISGSLLSSGNLPKTGTESVIYVMGGSQPVLESRFKKAAVIYRHGSASRILILSRPGITEFSPPLGRNFTNDEWAMEKLAAFGVNREDVEAVAVPECFWGTYNEAETVSELILKRGYRRLILVSSPHHAERSWNSFKKFLNNHNVDMEIYLSGDHAGRKQLVLEYFKLMIYNNILLPFS